MSRDELIQALSSTLKKNQVQELVFLAANGELPVHDLLDSCFLREKSPVAFRAAWVLEHVEVSAPSLFLPYFPEFIRRLPEQKNQSCQRHFTKILLHFTRPQASHTYKQALAAIPDWEPLVEVVFEWLINSQTPVAVKVNCLEVLLYLSIEFPWIKEELQAQTEFYLRDGSPAMQSRGRKILKAVQAKRLPHRLLSKA